MRKSFGFPDIIVLVIFNLQLTPSNTSPFYIPVTIASQVSDIRNFTVISLQNEYN